MTHKLKFVPQLLGYVSSTNFIFLSRNHSKFFLLRKWWDDLETTYLRKHHQKNLSFLELRPSLLHLPFEIRLRYPLVTSVSCRYSICSSVIKWDTLSAYLYFYVASSRGYLVTILNHFPYFRANPLLTTCPLSNFSIKFII